MTKKDSVQANRKALGEDRKDPLSASYSLMLLRESFVPLPAGMWFIIGINRLMI